MKVSVNKQKEKQLKDFILQVSSCGWRDEQGGNVREVWEMKDLLVSNLGKLLDILKESDQDISLCLNVDFEFKKFIDSLYFFGKQVYRSFGRQIVTEKMAYESRKRIVRLMYPVILEFVSIYHYFQAVRNLSPIEQRAYFMNDLNYYSEDDLTIINLINEDLERFNISGYEYDRLKKSCLALRGIIYKNYSERAKEIGLSFDSSLKVNS